MISFFLKKFLKISAKLINNNNYCFYIHLNLIKNFIMYSAICNKISQNFLKLF